MFVLKHLWAGLFGGVLLVAIFFSNLFWAPDWPVARYDGLFLIALLTQALFLHYRLESREEVAALVSFSVLGLGIEWYNTASGHWSYPEEGIFALAHVPLFVGAMYAAVGVCVIRMIRIFDMTFAPYPPRPVAFALAAAIYANFFTQHLWIDLRLGLFALIVLAFWRTRIWFTPSPGRRWWMPMLLSLGPGEEASLSVSLRLDDGLFEADVFYVGSVQITRRGEPRLDVPLRIKAGSAKPVEKPARRRPSRRAP